jgi:hypothetical protein
MDDDHGWKRNEMTTAEIMKAAQEVSASSEQLDDFLEANGGSVLDHVWDFVYYGNLPGNEPDSFIKIAFETYGKWKMERETRLQAIKRAYNLKAIREACQQYEQWRQSYWRRRGGKPPEGPSYDP